MLIRDVPDDVVAAIDAKAGRVGLSRAEYLRRVLVRERTLTGEVTIADLRRTAEVFADLADEEIMRGAWS